MTIVKNDASRLIDNIASTPIIYYCCPLKLFYDKKIRAGFLAWNSALLVTFVVAKKIQ